MQDLACPLSVLSFNFEFAKNHEEKMFSSAIVKAFFKAANNENFWINLDNRFIDAGITKDIDYVLGEFF